MFVRHVRPSRLVLFLIFLVSTAALAQDQRPMTLIDLLELPSLSDPQLSPDGTQLLYVLAESDWKANEQISHIWRVGTEGGEAVQLTNGPGGESAPRWSPDGRTIAFTATRPPAEATQIYLLPADGGEAQVLTDHETGVSGLTWSPDGQALYFLASDPKTEEQKKRDELKDDVYAFDENYQQRHLWKVTVEDQTETRLTEGEYSILGYTLSRDGAQIVAHQAPTPLYDNSDESEVWLMQADGTGAVQLTTNAIAEGRASLSPDGSHVLFTAGTNGAFEPYYNRNLFLVRVGPDAVAQPPLPDFPYEVFQAEWGPDANTVYVVANTGVRTQLLKIDLADASFEALTKGDHTLGGWAYDPDSGRHVFTRDTPVNPGDVWMLDAEGEALQQVSRVFDHLDETFQLPRQEAVTWTSEDGEAVEGLLIYPLNYQEGRAYPLVVQTHGGPASSDKFGFGENMTRYHPVFAAHGYAILKPNYRGSTGYGNAFLRDMVGQYYRNAHLDVMTGIDHVVEMGVADPERLAKMGWSAGGHMTNKIITFTDRFKAASSGAGAVNWISMYGQSDVRIYRTPWFGGTPWEENAPIEVYWENSPLKDIANVTTPTLVFVGQEDPRVPMPQSVELYRALRTNGVPTHLYVAPREGHGWSELRHRLFKMNAELDWFAEYVLDTTYTWETAPEEPDDEDAEAEPKETE